MAIGIALIDMYNEMQSEITADVECEEDILTTTDDESPKCPECGESISFEGGCNICKSCGWSKCD